MYGFTYMVRPFLIFLSLKKSQGKEKVWLMKKHIFKSKHSVHYKADRIAWLSQEFNRRDEAVKIHRLTCDLFDRLTEQLPGSGKIQLAQFADAMNQLICSQAPYYYANGLSDGAALTRMMYDDRLDVKSTLL